MGIEHEDFEELLKEFGEPKPDDLREKTAGIVTPNVTGRKTEVKEVQDTIDLHMHTSHQAIQVLNSFIHRTRHNRLKHVQVITGKGLHSENGKAVIRDVVETRLSEMKQKGEIKLFRWETGNKETSGAVDIYLD